MEGTGICEIPFLVRLPFFVCKGDMNGVWGSRTPALTTHTF